MDETGLVLGHGTCLVRLSQDGSLELESDRDRALALLSVAGRQTASPDALKPIEAAAADWRRGEKALANLRPVFAGLPRLDEPADAWRLRVAEILLDNGLSPRALMDELGLDPCPVDLGKFGFSPNQPRVPAGNGRESRRWEAFWNRVIAWLDEPVPEYDMDTGTEVGTRSRAGAIATNPITIIAAGAAVLGGGELLAAGALAEGVTIADVAAALPEGMTPAMLGS